MEAMPVVLCCMAWGEAYGVCVVAVRGQSEGAPVPIFIAKLADTLNGRLFIILCVVYSHNRGVSSCDRRMGCRRGVCTCNAVGARISCSSPGLEVGPAKIT